MLPSSTLSSRRRGRRYSPPPRVPRRRPPLLPPPWPAVPTLAEGTSARNKRAVAPCRPLRGSPPKEDRSVVAAALERTSPKSRCSRLCAMRPLSCCSSCSPYLRKSVAAYETNRWGVPFEIDGWVHARLHSRFSNVESGCCATEQRHATWRSLPSVFP